MSGIDQSGVWANRIYEDALRQGFWRRLRHWLGRGCNDLLTFEEIFSFLKGMPARDLGQQRLPLASIVGSSGRARDFDLAYYPRRRATAERWLSVARARYEGKALPPVNLFKVGAVYFVEDGNHRVSVARVRGEHDIDARVIELDTAVLRPEPKCERLGFKMGDKIDE